jgi:hypothetical protein
LNAFDGHLMKPAAARRRLIEIHCSGSTYALDSHGRHVAPMPRSRRRDLKGLASDLQRLLRPLSLPDDTTEPHCLLTPPAPFFPSFAPEPAATGAIEDASPEFPCRQLDNGFATAMGSISLQTVAYTDVFDA